MLRIEVNKGGIERALKNYKSKVINFLDARNQRIKSYGDSLI